MHENRLHVLIIGQEVHHVHVCTHIVVYFVAPYIELSIMICHKYRQLSSR